ncbi:MAG: FAD-dependent oxidoreductase [Ideonella sp.]|nr:FAD-dependent oxidoreductase [Ideonella sp.]
MAAPQTTPEGPAPRPGSAASRRLLWLAVVLLALGAAWAWQRFGLGQLLTLESLKASRDSLVAGVQQQPALSSAAYLLAYVAMAALSLPGATVLTLAGGAVFGFWWGLVLVSFASSIGATLAFLVARHLLRDAVQARFGKQLAPINEGMARDGWLYLLTLRLVPAFPFFLVNLVVALTPISATRFYGVSQLGMLAGTAVYVNAGTQLASLGSLRDVLSPALLGSFVLLGLFPLLAKAIVGALQRRKVYARWPRPARFERNLVVIGAGAGGLVSAYIAAAVKAKVTLVEGHRMGGDCLNTGCVPSKALIRSAKLAHQMRHAAEFGLNTKAAPEAVQVDFAAVMARVRQVVTDIEPHDSVERYTGLGVEVLIGHARITSPWTVQVTDSAGAQRTLSTRSIVIAAGAMPFVPPIPGLAEAGCLTSDNVWRLAALPPRLVVLGGGPIGCELAQSFARLGSQVTVVEMAPRVLVREDADAAEFVAQSLRSDGVALLTGHTAVRVESTGAARQLVVRAPDGTERALAYDELLCAVGRAPRVTGYGLEELGIPLTPRKTVATDAHLATLYPNIFAVGDVAGPFQLTHVAAHQAWYAAVNALFGRFKKFRVDYHAMPWCTFTDPELARVGLSEAEAQAQGLPFEVTRYDIADLDRAIADGSASGFVKVLTVPGKDKILGATIVGEHAGDLLAEFVLAMKHGLGLNKLLGTPHTYPTLAEANKYAAGEWKRAHAPQAVLRWVERYHRWQRG